jgi:hypothetical protein
LAVTLGWGVKAVEEYGGLERFESEKAY